MDIKAFKPLLVAFLKPNLEYAVSTWNPLKTGKKISWRRVRGERQKWLKISERILMK